MKAQCKTRTIGIEETGQAPPCWRHYAWCGQPIVIMHVSERPRPRKPSIQPIQVQCFRSKIKRVACACMKDWKLERSLPVFPFQRLRKSSTAGRAAMASKQTTP